MSDSGERGGRAAWSRRVRAGAALTVALAAVGWWWSRSRRPPQRPPDTPEAVQARLLAVARAPGDVDALRQAAFALARQRSYADALPFLRHALALAPGAARDRFALGQLYEALGHDERAVEAYRRAHELQPADLEVTLQLARLHIQRAWIGAARPLLEQAERQAPRDPRVHTAWGMLAAREGDRFKARRRFQQALAGDPDDARLCSMLAEVEQRDALIGEALRWVDRAIERRPDDLAYLSQKISLLLSEGQSDAADIDEAERLCQRVLARDPANLGILFQHARVQRMRGNREAALYLFRSVFARQPNLATVALELGNLYARLGEREESDRLLHYYETVNNLSRERGHLEWLTLLNPDDVEAHWNYARFCYQKDDPATAAYECWRILELDPRHRAARRLRDKALYRAGRWGEIGGE